MGDTSGKSSDRLQFLCLAEFLLQKLLVCNICVRPNKPNKVKEEAYECGIPASGEARSRYSVRFYIIAVLFVVFDVETIFLFPWAVKYRMLGAFGFISMFVFLGILLIGFAYAWKKGALEWV